MNSEQSDSGYARGEILASAAWLAAHLGDSSVKVLDARDRGQYTAGHVSGAISLGSPAIFKAPGSQEPVSGEEFARQAGALGVQLADTIICYDDEGPLAARAWWAFWRFGHRDVRFLNGGLRQWIAAGGSLSQESREPVPSTYVLGEPRDGAACSLPQARAALGQPGVQFWDTRTAAEYAGEAGRFGLPPRPGHIPGAVQLEWGDLTDAKTGMFKPAAEMRRILAAKGLDPEREVITY